MLTRILAGLLCLALTALSRPAGAAESNKEAAERFDRGLRLFNDGDDTGALLEFKRAYELSGKPAILVNVGLVYAVLGRPVEAVAALDKVLQQPAGIPEAQLGQARRVHDEQAARIGRLLVTTNVPAQVEIDNLAVDRTPMAVPMSVASGIRLLGVVAPGHVPIRQEVSITGGRQTDVAVELLPLQGALANLQIRCILPGADVLVDGKLVGRTPLPASVPLAPGSHEVSLRRPGYRAIPQTVSLADGSTGEITLEVTEVASEAELVGARVSLDVSQPDATVVIDGVLRTGFRDGLLLPAGPHRLSITRTGFLPLERELTVDKGPPKTVRIQLQPTEEIRAAHVHRVWAQRRNALITMGAGLVVGGVGTYFIVKAHDDQRDADNASAAFQASQQPGGSCYLTKGGSIPQSCQVASDHVTDLNNSAKLKKWIGWGMAGAGAATLVTGTIFLLVTDSIDDVKIAGVQLHPYAWALPNGGGTGLGGRF